jgi:hypothetical protein
MTTEEGEITLEDLNAKETTDEYGQRINPAMIPQDAVQADYVWYDPTPDDKGIVSKNMTLSFLEEHDMDWVYMTVDLINILDMINSNLHTQYSKEGLTEAQATEKLKSLVDSRNDIKIELDTRLSVKRSLKGRTAILSRTATHRLEQLPAPRPGEERPQQKKGLRRLIPL